MIVDEKESSDEPEGSAGDSTEVFDRHSNDQMEDVEDVKEFDRHSNDQMESAEDEKVFDRRHTNDQMDREDDEDEKFDSEVMDGVGKRVAKKPAKKATAKKAKKPAKKATAKKAKKTAKKAKKKKARAADQTSERPDEEEFDRQHANDPMVSQGESLFEYGISWH